MTKHITFLALCFVSLVFALPACKEENAGGGGGSGGGGSGETGTCESTCKKSIALGCMNGEHDQTACVASCKKQESSCSATMAAEFQAYLDCIESTPMECGSSTGAPSSPDCLSQGLMVLACSLGS